MILQRQVESPGGAHARLSLLLHLESSAPVLLFLSVMSDDAG